MINIIILITTLLLLQQQLLLLIIIILLLLLIILLLVGASHACGVRAGLAPLEAGVVWCGGVQRRVV